MKLAKKELKDRTKKAFVRLGISSFFADTLIESLWRDPVPGAAESDGSRGSVVVSWISGLWFEVSEAVYYINNKIYRSPYTKVQLISDAVYARYVVFAADINGQVVVIYGEPSANPLLPTVDLSTQIYLTHVFLPAGATVPADIQNEIVYNENTEWIGSSSVVSVNFSSTSDPETGSVCAEISNIAKFNTITWKDESIIHDFDNYSALAFSLRLKEEMPVDHILIASLHLDGVRVGMDVKLDFQRLNLNWQRVSLSMDSFVKTGTKFNQIRLKYGTKASGDVFAGFFIDRFILQKGIAQPPAQADTFVTGLEFDEENRELTLKQNNEKDDFKVKITGAEKTRTIIQAGHGLTLENAIRYDGSKWVKAQADNDVNAQTRAIVVKVIDSNTFLLQSNGFFASDNFVPGVEYCLSPDAAGMIIPIPVDDPFNWIPGQVRQVLGTGVPGGFEINIDAGDLIDDIVMITADGIEGNGLEDDPIRPVFGTEEKTVCEGNDERLSDSREWTAEVVSQEEAEAGTATTARKWTAERVKQAINALGGPSGGDYDPAGTAADAINTHESTYDHSKLESLTNYSVQQLTGTNPTWNMVNGLNAKITISANTQITLQNVPVGQSGNLSVGISGNVGTAFKLKFVYGTTYIYAAPNLIITDGQIDEMLVGNRVVLSWYYDGVYVYINGTTNYKLQAV